MFPTLHAPRTLEEVVPHPMQPARVLALLREAGLSVRFGEFVLRSRDVRLVARGISNHGYAEIDCRRSASQVRWVVFRVPPAQGGTGSVLIMEIGYWGRPPPARRGGVDLERPPDRKETRTDVYGRQREYRQWEKNSGKRRVVVRRVSRLGSGRIDHWEVLHYRPLG